MSDKDNTQLNEQDVMQEEDTSIESSNEEGIEEDSSRNKSRKSRKSDKRSAREDRKEDARLYKEWRDSIVANKRVKREERRRNLKKAMLIMLIFSLIVTSIVYVMLLFVSENNVRITASQKDKDKAISLSFDNDYWTPYINAHGPESLWDISYNRVYEREPVMTKSEVLSYIDPMLMPEDIRPDRDESIQGFILGEQNGDNYICFTFMLKNEGPTAVTLTYDMTLEYDDVHNLQDAVRVMWGESYRLDHTGDKTDVAVYASLSHNPRLANTMYNVDAGMNEETGYIECIAYPQGSYNPGERYYDLSVYEQEVFADGDYQAIMSAYASGYEATTPFASTEFVFHRESTLEVGDIMYCYVCIWLEGSDFDCVDNAIGGYVKMGIDFVAG